MSKRVAAIVEDGAVITGHEDLSVLGAEPSVGGRATSLKGGRILGGRRKLRS